MCSDLLFDLEPRDPVADPLIEDPGYGDEYRKRIPSTHFEAVNILLRSSTDISERPISRLNVPLQARGVAEAPQEHMLLAVACKSWFDTAQH